MRAPRKGSLRLLAGIVGGLLALQCSGGVGEGADVQGTRDEAPASLPSAVLATSAASLPPGRLSLAGDGLAVRSLGQLREGEGAEVDFELLAEGPGPLSIESIQPSCGCTVAGLYLLDGRDGPRPYELGRPIAPGTRLRLVAKVHTQGQEGSFSTSIVLTSDDPAGPQSVRVEAEIEPMLDLRPGRRVLVEDLLDGQEALRTVRVETRRRERFLLLETYLPEGIALALEPLDPDEQGRSSAWDVRLTLGPGLPPGDVAHTLRLETDLPIADPREPRDDGAPTHHLVVLEVQKLGLVQAEPAFVNFGPVDPGASVERAVRLRSRDGHALPTGADVPFVVLDATGGPFELAEQVRATLEPTDVAGEVDLRLRVECPPLERERSLVGAVHVRVGHPWQSTVIVRFLVSFRSSTASGSQER